MVDRVEVIQALVLEAARLAAIRAARLVVIQAVPLEVILAALREEEVQDHLEGTLGPQEGVQDRREAILDLLEEDHLEEDHLEEVPAEALEETLADHLEEEEVTMAETLLQAVQEEVLIQYLLAEAVEAAGQPLTLVEAEAEEVQLLHLLAAQEEEEEILQVRSTYTNTDRRKCETHHPLLFIIIWNSFLIPLS